MNHELELDVHPSTAITDIEMKSKNLEANENFPPEFMDLSSISLDNGFEIFDHFDPDGIMDFLDAKLENEIKLDETKGNENKNENEHVENDFAKEFQTEANEKIPDKVFEANEKKVKFDEESEEKICKKMSEAENESSNEDIFGKKVKFSARIKLSVSPPRKRQNTFLLPQRQVAMPAFISSNNNVPNRISSEHKTMFNKFALSMKRSELSRAQIMNQEAIAKSIARIRLTPKAQTFESIPGFLNGSRPTLTRGLEKSRKQFRAFVSNFHANTL